MWEGDRSELASLVLTDLVADCRAHPSQVCKQPAAGRPDRGLQRARAATGGTGKLNDEGGWLFSVWAALDTDDNF